MTLERLGAETIEDGQEHPFTEALVRELVKRRTTALHLLEGSTPSTSEAYLRTHAARAAAFKEVIDLINGVRGTE